MERKQSQFDLLNSMMSRLGVTPGMLTMEWLKNNAVSFVCIPQENSKKGVNKGITGKIVSARLATTSKTETDPIIDASKPKQTKNPKGKNAASEAETPKQESLFYNQDWEEIGDEFKLTQSTISQVRCGMFAYFHGSKVVITKKRFSSQKEKNQNYTRLGVVFDLQENVLQILSLCVPMSNYSKVLKKLLADHRLPTGDECVKIFVYKELLHRGFEKLNINFKDVKEIFYEDSNHQVGKIGVFDFQEGNSTERSKETAQADAYQVQTIQLD